DISLDPEIGSFHLTVPQDFKDLKKFHFNLEDQPDQEEYFVTVLGAQTFTSGTHYWEVDVEGQEDWVVGICEDSIIKNGNVSILFENVRAMLASKDSEKLLTWIPSNFFFMDTTPKVGILLNYEEGYVSFYHVRGRWTIFSLRNSAFQGPVCPFFSTSLFNKGRTT
ncbi:probable E3 ubiquitin-protein ligase TRIML1, partial [Gracilinanus agilis]|uniref:probable E3 ubiquitin-protein ligase TRIML1 n=1 Tax=Gracilinanus agilis TaxID=191870 RepID=UPI001CFE7B06